ncbi:hypothetical protein FHW23_003453, partial [Curtobacterium pusillum]|nr:hypothetical protein [Curtobacterium pusillum]
MTNRPDLFLLNVSYDVTGVHGHVFFRDPPRACLVIAGWFGWEAWRVSRFVLLSDAQFAV